MNEIILQGIGFIGVALFIVSYQLKSNRALFMCQLLGCTAFCVQFFLMGALTGAISLIINIARNVLLIKAKKWKWARSNLFLYTDGVPEAKSANGERFGMDRLTDVLKRNRGLTPKQIVTDVKWEVDSFQPKDDPFDDVTIMSVVWKGGK